MSQCVRCKKDAEKDYRFVVAASAITCSKFIVNYISGR